MLKICAYCKLIDLIDWLIDRSWYPVDPINNLIGILNLYNSLVYFFETVFYLFNYYYYL